MWFEGTTRILILMPIAHLPIVDAGSFFADQGRLEQHFGASESFVADDDDVAVGKLVGFLQSRGFGGGLGFCGGKTRWGWGWDRRRCDKS